MDAVLQYRTLSRYFIDDLNLLILIYLHESADAKQFRFNVDQVLRQKYSGFEETYKDSIYAYSVDLAKTGEDQILANLVKYRIGTIDLVLDAFVTWSEQPLKDFPEFEAEVIKYLNQISRDDFIYLTRRGDWKINSLETAIKYWQNSLSFEGYKNLTNLSLKSF